MTSVELKVLVFGATGGTGLCNDPERMYLLYKWTIKRWFQPCYDDMGIMENIFLNNNDDINYVFVRPAYLNNNIPDKELRVDMDGKFLWMKLMDWVGN
ncbi:unnamed protein product [Rhizophagus irregularis]|nr:unnamed protein product [Rhizophagus irregularis]